MRRISLVALLACVLLPAEATKPLSEVDALRLENFELRAQLAMAKFEVARLTALSEVAKMREESNALTADVLRRADLKPEDWRVDLPSRQILPKGSQ